MGHKRQLASDELEQKILSCVLRQDPDALDFALTLPPEAFYYENNRVIYKAILALAAQGLEVDRFTVIQQLVESGAVEGAGGAAYVIGIDDPAAVNIQSYVSQVRNLFRLRELESTLQESLASVTAPGATPDGILARLSDYTSANMVSHDSKRDPGVEVWDLFDPTANAYIRTKYKKLDDLIGGLHYDLNVVGARPSMGKSAFMRCLLRNAMSGDDSIRTAIASYDQDAKQIYWLEAATLSNVPLEWVKRDVVRLKAGMQSIMPEEKLHAYRNKLKEVTKYYPEYMRISNKQMPFPELLAWMRVQAQVGVKVIAIDYLQQIVHPSHDDPRKAINAITRDLKSFAIENQVAVLLLSQLNRGVESRDNKRPRLGDLKESGSIEQDASLLMMLYREEYYTHREMGMTEPPVSEAEVIVSKNKEGPPGTVNLVWDGRFTKFTERSASSIREQ